MALVARRAARCGALGRTDEVRGGFRRGADLRDAAFLWLGFQLSRSKSRGVRKGPGEHAGALTWGATFAEAMVAIVNAALTRVYAFACGDNGAGRARRREKGSFLQASVMTQSARLIRANPVEINQE